MDAALTALLGTFEDAELPSREWWKMGTVAKLAVLEDAVVRERSSRAQPNEGAAAPRASLLLVAPITIVLPHLCHR